MGLTLLIHTPARAVSGDSGTGSDSESKNINTVNHSLSSMQQKLNPPQVSCAPTLGKGNSHQGYSEDYRMTAEEKNQSSAGRAPSLKMGRDLILEMAKYLTGKDLIKFGLANPKTHEYVAAYLARADTEVDLTGVTLSDKQFEALFGKGGIYENKLHVNLNGADFNQTSLRHLPKTLKTLKLSDTDRRITSVGVAHISQLSELERLDMSRLNYMSYLGDVGVETLSKLKKLQYLDLSKCSLSGTALEHLSGLKDLKTLNFTNNRVSAQGITALAKGTSIQELNLNDCDQMDDKVAEQIGTMVNLKKLEIEGARLSETGWEHLSHLDQLQYLDVNHMKEQLRDNSLKQLLKLKQLKTLLANFSFIGSGNQVRQLKALTNLETLALNYNDLEDEVVKALVSLSQLKDLSLQDNSMTEVGAGYLSKMTHLDRLDVSGNPFNTLINPNGTTSNFPDGNKKMAALRIALPKTEILPAAPPPLNAGNPSSSHKPIKTNSASSFDPD